MSGNIFKTEYKLKQHTMLLHFQAKPTSEENVCLRASEVKPKLDRFIVKKFNGKEEFKQAHPSWIQAEHQNEKDVALKYRMTIVRCSEKMNIYETDHRTTKERKPKNNEYKPGPEFVLPNIYYGNMGDGQEMYGVFFLDGLQVSVTCFIPELKKYIDDNITEFFAVTNFGTMQNKGFGSFTIKGTKEETVIKALKNNYDSEKCFKVAVNQSGYANEAQKTLFETVKQVYSVMKSGQNILGHPDKYIRSFIYEYMHNLYKVNGEQVNIGNEKAYLKKEGVAPIRTTHKPKNEHECDKQSDIDNNNFRYVRALLGIAENIEWNEPENEQTSSKLRKEKISISDITYSDEKDKDKNIVRCPSPVFFKIVNNNIYITANSPNKKVIGRKFKFYNDGYTRGNAKRSSRYSKSIELSTLNKNESLHFDMADFLTKYRVYYNRNINKFRRNLHFRIVEV